MCVYFSVIVFKLKIEMKIEEKQNAQKKTIQTKKSKKNGIIVH